MASEFSFAVDTFFKAPDNDTRSKVTKWLQDFECSDASWDIVTLAISNLSNDNARLYAAQVLKRKVIRDLYKLSIERCFYLRDAVLNMLSTLEMPPTIITQLCCALAELAIHIPAWENPIRSVSEMLAHRNETFPAFLEFITVLPEQLVRSERVFNREEYNNRFSELLTVNSETCFQFLMGYLQSNAVHSSLKKKLFVCIENWVSAPAIELSLVVQSQLMEIAFSVLNTELMESATSILAAIYEMSYHEVNNMTLVGQKIIQVSYPRLQEARKLLVDAADDEEIARTIIKLFTAAFHCLHPAFISDQKVFLPLLVEVLVPLCGLPFVDLLEPAFEFCYYLSESISEIGSPAAASFQDLFCKLVDVIVKHLEYPDEQMTEKELEHFRDNRYEVGSVLKYSTSVLGSRTMLNKFLLMLQEAENDARKQINAANAWRKTESLIFAFRAISMEVPKSENEVMPVVMSKMPMLMETFNNHPKIRYALILLIGGYTEWTEAHPAYLNYQMAFISEGFAVSQCSSSAARTLRHLGQDCGSALHPYMEQLHPFYVLSLQKMAHEDIIYLTEAVAYIILASPPADMLRMLSQFTAPLITELKNHSNSIKNLRNILNRLTVFFSILHPKKQVLAALSDKQTQEVNLFDGKTLITRHPLLLLLKSIWPDILKLLEIYPKEDDLTEEISKIIRNLLEEDCVRCFTASDLQEIVDLMVRMYESTGFSCWLWVSSHIINRFCSAAHLVPALFAFIERMTHITIMHAQRTGVAETYENINELYCLLTLLIHLRADLILSWQTMLTPILHLAMQALYLDYQRPLNSVSFFLCDLFKSLSQNADVSNLRASLLETGEGILRALLYRRIVDKALPFESHRQVVSVLKYLAVGFPSEFNRWVSATLAVFPQFFSENEAAAIMAEFKRGTEETGHARFHELIEKMVRLHDRRMGRLPK